MSDYPYTAGQDLDFALASGEFRHLTPALRYVATLHPELSRAAFVEQMGAKGIHPGTALKQFGLSRKFDIDNWGCKVRPDGVMIEAEEREAA